VEPRRLVSEAQWLETIAARHGLPDGNVGRAASNTEEAAHTIAQQSESPLTRNIRNKSHEEASPAGARWAMRLYGQPTQGGYESRRPQGLSFDRHTLWWRPSQRKSSATSRGRKE